jgi:hypothetical protein
MRKRPSNVGWSSAATSSSARRCSPSAALDVGRDVVRARDAQGGERAGLAQPVADGVEQREAPLDRTEVDLRCRVATTSIHAMSPSAIARVWSRNGMPACRMSSIQAFASVSWLRIHQ